MVHFEQTRSQSDIWLETILCSFNNISISTKISILTSDSFPLIMSQIYIKVHMPDVMLHDNVSGRYRFLYPRKVKMRKLYELHCVTDFCKTFVTCQCQAKRQLIYTCLFSSFLYIQTTRKTSLLSLCNFIFIWSYYSVFCSSINCIGNSKSKKTHSPALGSWHYYIMWIFKSFTGEWQPLSYYFQCGRMLCEMVTTHYTRGKNGAFGKLIQGKCWYLKEKFCLFST